MDAQRLERARRGMDRITLRRRTERFRNDLGKRGCRRDRTRGDDGAGDGARADCARSRQRPACAAE